MFCNSKITRGAPMVREKLVWPDHIASSGNTGLDSFRKDKDFNCSAGEALGLYGPLHHFLLQLDLGQDPVAQSLLLAFRLLEVCHSSMKRALSPEVLHHAATQHLVAFKKAHGEAACVPKHHFMMHVAQSFQRTGYLLNCYVMERKHKAVKLIANNRHTVSKQWAKQLLEQVSLNYLQRLQDYDGPFRCDTCSLNAKVRDADPRIVEAFQQDFPGRMPPVTALSAYVRGNIVKQKDVVAFLADSGQRQHGQVMQHCESSGHLLTIIAVWQPLSAKNHFRCGTDVLQWVETRRIQGSVIYMPMDNDVAVVIPHDDI